MIPILRTVRVRICSGRSRQSNKECTNIQRDGTSQVRHGELEQGGRGSRCDDVPDCSNRAAKHQGPIEWQAHTGLRYLVLSYEHKLSDYYFCSKHLFGCARGCRGGAELPLEHLGEGAVDVRAHSGTRRESLVAATAAGNHA
jgi:hypothetical protein